MIHDKNTESTYTNNDFAKENLSGINEQLSVRLIKPAVLNGHGKKVGVPEKLFSYEHLRITAEKEILRSEPKTKLNGIPIAADKNVTLMVAEPKAGKTAAFSAIQASYLSDDGRCMYFNSIQTVLNSLKKAVVSLDTEQSEADHQDNVRGILYRSGQKTTPPYYYAYNVRSLSFSEMKTALEQICIKSAKECCGIYAIFLDGVADLVASVNDEAEANAMVAHITQLSILYDCPVFVVLHQNPNSTKERGHIGSQFGRKCYAAIAITKKDNVSTIDFKYMRKAGGDALQPINFKYDSEKGFHIEIEEQDQGEVLANKAARMADELKALAIKVLPPLASLTHTELIDKLITLGITESTAKNRKRAFLAHGFITKGRDELYRFSGD